MNLFTRQATLAPEHLQEGLAYTVEIAQYVSEKTALDVIPWTTMFGAPLGSVSWSARVDSQAALGAVQDTLAADSTFQARVKDASRFFTGSPEDAIGQFVAFSGTGGEIRQYASIVTAQCAAGKVAEAMAWGVDMMQYVGKLTGLDSSIVRGIYGPFATLVWISLADSLDEVDAADAAMSSDPSYLERLDQAGDLFQPGSAQQRLIRRLA
jgi:hypothetical protein